mgnify:CR=1 FL=1
MVLVDHLVVLKLIREEIVDVLFAGRPGVPEELDILAEVIPIAKGLYVQYTSADRIGLKRGFSFSITLWSLAAMAHATARGAGSLSLFRFLLGFGDDEIAGVHPHVAHLDLAVDLDRLDAPLAVGAPAIGLVVVPVAVQGLQR